jgi:hypothetical protein
MQHTRTNNLIETTPQSADFLDWTLVNFNIGQVIFTLEGFSMADASRAYVDSDNL